MIISENNQTDAQQVTAIQGSRTIKDLDELKRIIRKLLEVDNVGVLLGAGASIDAGGKTMSGISDEVLPVMESCFNDGEKFWEKLVDFCTNKKGNFIDIEGLVTYLTNLEHLSNLEDKEYCISFSKTENIEKLPRNDIQNSLKAFKHKIFELCSLPTKEEEVETYNLFLKKILAHRRANQSRLSIFTTNYDLLVEKACDRLGITYINGFHGIENRKFHPEVFDLDLHRVEVGERHKYHFYDKVIHLLKLHGSLTWIAEEDPQNPFSITEKPYEIIKEKLNKSGETLSLMIYPSSAKYGEATGFPYSEMFRRFSAFLTKSQTVLFTIGYGFNDNHVNAIIRQGLSQPTMTLVAFLPELKQKDNESFCVDNSQSNFAGLLLNSQDSRIILVGNENAKWKFIVNKVIPDIDEEDPLDQIKRTLNITGKA